ncbi:MAG TPA: FHA domain-containing protein [Rudaea sp.]|nr:FHA domain-containing protein [Rudaea sp.]
METLSVRRGVLELVDRNGRVEQRVVLNGNAVTIGRAYDNEFILDDLHVSPHHARISLEGDGVWRLRDLGSVNGIRLDNGRRVDELPIDGEQSFMLGLCQLRYRPADAPVPEAEPLRERRQLRRAVVILAPLLCLAAFALDADLDSYETFGALKALSVVLATLVAIVIWSAIWALIGRLFAQRLNFPGHLAVISGGLLFASVFESLSHLGAFAFAFDQALPWFDAIGVCATFVLILYGHLRLASRLHRRGALIGAVAFGILLAGAVQIKQIVYAEQFSTRPRIGFTLAAPALRVASPRPVSAFYAQATDGLTRELADDAPHANAPARSP